MGGGRITGQQLFADVRGAAGSTALLFVHGGPGQGAYQFMAVQGDRLSDGLRVIGLDQRGVDRSAPLPAGAGLTIADLVEDCEAARHALGVDRWVALGQSFGGIVALRYAVTYPDALRAVIFENPAWDLGLTTRAALPRIAGLLGSLGRDAAARTARAAAASGGSPRELWAAYMAALDALGDERLTYYLPDPVTRQRLHEVDLARPERPQADEQAASESTTRHHLAIMGDATVFESSLPALPRLGLPALLITGGQDPTTSPEQRDAFRRASPRHATAEFSRAGHFVHADEPDRYARTVIDFVRDAV